APAGAGPASSPLESTGGGFVDLVDRRLALRAPPRGFGVARGDPSLRSSFQRRASSPGLWHRLRSILRLGYRMAHGEERLRVGSRIRLPLSPVLGDDPGCGARALAVPVRLRRLDWAVRGPSAGRCSRVPSAHDFYTTIPRSRRSPVRVLPILPRA